MRHLSYQRTNREALGGLHRLGCRTGLGCMKAALWGVLLLSIPLFARPAAAQNDANNGVEAGNYHSEGSFELGYRFVNTLGSQPVYDTFVNQQQGPRFLDETLNMRSLDHEGVLFDNLFFSSFGWGGDPENSARLRMSKNKWYNFDASFRRDRNFFDYNALANPLNPPNPYIQNNNSPHEFETVRRMYDYNLTVLPQAPVRFRLGFTRNNMEGPAFSSVHQGTDALVFQNTRTLLDGYQIGVDFKLLPRTNISYDQFLQYYKGDTSWSDQNFIFQLSNGTAVDPGISYNPAANAPCATPIQNAATTPPTFTASCNGYQSYSRWAPVRISYPTEQLTVQSSYFRKLDLSARVSYSSSQMNVTNWFEDFAGFASRTRLRASTINGPSGAERVVDNADFGATLKVTEKFRVIDSFRFSYFRIPGTWDLTTASLFGANLLATPNVFSAATCPPPFTAATCPQHSASSGADLTQDHRSDFLGQDDKTNTFELEYDITPRVTGHLGYRYQDRTIANNQFDLQNLTIFPNNAIARGCPTAAGCNVVSVVSSTAPIDVHAHSVLAGVSARPTDQLRASFDLELLSADNAVTRISPRNLQHYKGRVNYKPRSWIDISGTVNILESRNNVPNILHREHDRNYGFTAQINPQPRFGMELGYNYNDIFSTTNICYILTGTPPADSTVCGSGSPYFSANSLYTNKINFGFANFMVKPAPRVTVRVGYSLTSSSGETPTLANPAVFTSLGFNYHRPSAALDVSLAKGVTWVTAWGYYDYNEKFFSFPLVPRDFQTNTVTLSLRYEF
ncbi:MAG TPA: hypothetical protein VFO39_22670 [Candidatus Sulfotelmatobacter sp.]|nr:hypothetical protein [Candidatus Sulfotelmatobacter sp.]